MTFDFPIRQNIRTAWALYRKHWRFFSAMTIFTLLLNSTSEWVDRLSGFYNIFGMLCFILLAVISSFVWVRISLAVARGDESMLSFSRFRDMLPTGTQFFKLIGVGLLTGIIVLGGFVAFIIPGVYCMVRLAFVNLALVDKNLSVGAAVKYSWHLVASEKFWTVLLVLLVSLVLIVIGAATLGIGLIIIYPVVMMLIAHLYKALDDFHLANPEPQKIS